jgi:hypothetical protein
MIEFVSKAELAKEATTVDPIDKLPAYGGKKYPIEYLTSRDFERLVYFIFQNEIASGQFKDIYDAVYLMKGTAERGRDSILQFKGKNVAVIQCKRYVELVTLPNLCREIIKFCLHSIQDEEMVADPNDFTYYFIALKGLNEKALSFQGKFNENILKTPKLESWTDEVLEENESLKFRNYAEVETRLKKILATLKVKILIGEDLDKKLKNANQIVKIFFEVEKVVDRELMWEFGEMFLGFKSNEDLEKLRVRLQDIPAENKFKFGIFTLYGYDKGFYQKLTVNKKIFFQIADIKLEISKLFTNYLKETIEKYNLIFITGLLEVSPFTKQVVMPYLFNNFALIYNRQETGDFLHKIANFKGIITERQTIDEHKKYFLEVGGMVLRNDFSSFFGDHDLIEFKKEVAHFIHAEFKTVEEMSLRFDRDMVILKPIIEKIEAEITKIMPSNGTLIIENSSSIKTEDDFVSILKNLPR